MKVVDVRDFCIPSDGNDYDELVAFADTMAGVQQFDAVPIDVLDKIRAEIEAIIGEHNLDDYDFCSGLICARKIIDKYREEQEDAESN